MKIYLAATFSRNKEMRGIRTILKKYGHIVTSRWIDLELASEHRALLDLNSRPNEFAHYAQADLEDIEDSDLLISFTSEDGGGKGGRHIELGYALASLKRLIIIGPRENVFHTLAFIEVYPTFEDFINFCELPSSVPPEGFP